MRKITYSSEIHAPFDTVWQLLLRRVENAGGYTPGVRQTLVIQRHDDTLVREVQGEGLTIREKVTIDRQKGEIRFDLQEHPLFSGFVIQRAVPRSLQSPVAPIQLTMIVDWVPKDEIAEQTILENMPSAIQDEVLSLKDEAEKSARR